MATLITLSLLGPAITTPAHAQTQQASEQRYDIPPGPLGPALNRFGQQAGILLSFSPSQVTDLESQGLRGNYTVSGGLQTLLAGTGLEAASSAEGGYLLRQAPTALQPISVDATAPTNGPVTIPAFPGGQVASGGRLGVLGDMDVMDTPFNLTAYTDELLTDQQARSVADALLNNDASVRVVSGRGDLNEDFTIRGFPVSSQDVALNGTYGLLPYWRVPVEFAERVELLRGPSALLNGMSPSGSVGGAINLVPKRAGDTPLTRLNLDYTSDTQAGTHLDVGRRFGADNRVGVRFNGVYRQGDTAVEDQSRESPLMALALDYRGERLRLSLDLLHQKEKLDGIVRPVQVSEGAAVPDAPDADRLFGMKNSYSDDETNTIATRAEYDLAPNMTAFIAVGGRKNHWDTQAANLFVSDGDTGEATYGAARQRAIRRTLSTDVGLKGRLETGSVTHQWALSATRLKHREGVVYEFKDSVPGNLYAPAEDLPFDFSSLDGHIPTTQEQVFSGLALTDRLFLLDERLQLTLGARRQWVKVDTWDQNTREHKDYAKQVWTPLAGIAVTPLSNLTFYGNVIEGLSAGATPPPTASNPNAKLAPYKTRQYELGVKYDGGRLGAILAAYQIKKPNAFTGSDGIFRADGEQRNRGVEVNLFGEPVAGLRLLAGLNYIQPHLSRTRNGANDGNDAPGVARRQANLGVDWDVLRDVSVSARWIHTGEAYLDASNSRKIPDWQRFDLGARYRWTVSGKAMVLRANLENVLGEDYWQGASGYEGLTIGNPRTVSLSLSMDL